MGVGVIVGGAGVAVGGIGIKVWVGSGVATPPVEGAQAANHNVASPTIRKCLAFFSFAVAFYRDVVQACVDHSRRNTFHADQLIAAF